MISRQKFINSRGGSFDSMQPINLPPLPESNRLKNTSDGCWFLNARDYSFDIDGANSASLSIPRGYKDLKSDAPRVAVVIGYFDGQDYVCDQLRSILDQSHSAVNIYLCDDKSEPRFSFDGLRLDADQLSQISIGVRPSNIGFTNNFLNALGSIPDDFEYFAFSDQDDIWHQDKLERALAALAKAPTEKPALYCARTEIADATCEHTLGHSPRFNKPPSFANALVQNIGGGNTMVFNRAARDLINLSALKGNESHVFVKGDISDAALLKNLLSRYKPRAIVNFAAESHVDRSIHGPEEITFRKGWISEAALTTLVQPMLKNGYGQYLMQVIKESDYESH